MITPNGDFNNPYQQFYSLDFKKSNLYQLYMPLISIIPIKVFLFKNFKTIDTKDWLKWDCKLNLPNLLGTIIVSYTHKHDNMLWLFQVLAKFLSNSLKSFKSRSADFTNLINLKFQHPFFITMIFLELKLIEKCAISSQAIEEKMVKF